MANGFVAVARPAIPAMSPVAPDISNGLITARDVDATNVPRSGKTRFENLVDHTSGHVNAASYFAKSYVAGTSDATSALNLARDAAYSSGKRLVIPPGTHLTDGLVLLQGMSVHGFTGGAGNSSGYFLAAPSTASVLKARSANVNILEVDGDANGYCDSLEVGYLGLLGPTGNGSAPAATGDPTKGNGFYSHGSAATVGNSGFLLHDMVIGGMGSHGIYAPLNWHSTYERIHLDNCADNLIEVQGGNSSVLDRCYAHRVTAGKAGYRIYGSATLRDCSGIDYNGGVASGDWGVFGQSVALDGVLSVPHITLDHCNLEDFGRYGAWFHQGGACQVRNGTNFTAPLGGTVTAIRFETQPSKGNILDSSTQFILKSGAAWQDGRAIYSPFAPFIALGDGVSSAAWNGSFQVGGGLIETDPNDGSIVASPFKLSSVSTRMQHNLSKTQAWTPNAGAAIANGASASVDITSFPQIAGVIAGLGTYVTTCGFTQNSGVALPAGVMLSAQPSAANTVRLNLFNGSGSSQTFTAGVASALVLIVG